VTTSTGRSGNRPEDVPLEERVTDCLDGLTIGLIGEVTTDGICVRRVGRRLADVIDRGPGGEDLVQLIGGDIHILTEINQKFVSKAVDNKIKQMLLL